MKKIAVLLIVFFIISQISILAFEVKIDKMPSNIDEFLELRDKIANTPEGGAAIFLISLITFVENHDLGRQMFVIAIDQSLLVSGNVYRGYALPNTMNRHLRRMAESHRKHIPYAYITGTSSKDGYKASLPYTFIFSHNPYTKSSDGTMRILAECTGAASPRPIRMKENDKGIWKALEFSSMFLDVVRPEERQVDDL